MYKKSLLLLLFVFFGVPACLAQSASPIGKPTAYGKSEPATAVRIGAPRWFDYRTSYGRFDAAALKRFGEAGVDIVNFHPFNVLSAVGVPYSPYPPIWIGPRKYDFQSLDRHIADLLAVNPRAKFICNIDLNTPAWWPRWLGRSKYRDDSFTKLGKIAASEEWRGETKEYLQSFLRYTEGKYRDRIVGYMLTGSCTLEWQDQSMGEESACRREAWRKWMTAQGLPDPVDIPPCSVREHVSHGIFRDPVADALAIHYWRFHHWLVGDTILYFAAAAQELLQHRVPLGTFYGYVLEHAKGRLLYEGHLDFDRVFASPLLDFIETPGSYHDRQIGGASGFMVCLDSLNLHGKRLVHQIDHRTHTARSVSVLGQPVPGHRDGFPDVKSSIAGMRRDFSMALVRGTALVWFNLLGGWFEGQPVMDAIAQMRQIWDRCSRDPAAPVAQVAVLVDAQSMLYVDGNAAIVNDFLSRQRHGLGRMGTPYEVYSLADLPALDLARHKLILLPNLFVLDKTKREWLKRKVCTGGKTVVWVYAPGIIADGRFDPANVESLSGVPFGTAELTTRVMDGWRSVFSPTPNLSAQTLRRVAREAGVHIYCDTEEPLYANSRFLALHSTSGGKRTLKLPRECAQVRELFSGRILGKNVTAFDDNLVAPDTVLYELRSDGAAR